MTSARLSKPDSIPIEPIDAVLSVDVSDHPTGRIVSNPGGKGVDLYPKLLPVAVSLRDEIDEKLLSAVGAGISRMSVPEVSPKLVSVGERGDESVVNAASGRSLYGGGLGRGLDNHECSVTGRSSGCSAGVSARGSWASRGVPGKEDGAS